MGKFNAVTLCLLMLVAPVMAQTAYPQIERLLPQWLTGTIALVAFLFLVFVTFLVKKAWCGEKRTKVEVKENDLNTNENGYDTHLDLVRSKEEANAYDNLEFHREEERVTAM